MQPGRHLHGRGHGSLLEERGTSHRALRTSLKFTLDVADAPWPWADFSSFTQEVGRTRLLAPVGLSPHSLLAVLKGHSAPAFLGRRSPLSSKAVSTRCQAFLRSDGAVLRLPVPPLETALPFPRAHGVG